ncbi:MAG: 50S ribosomal protein L17 [Firmicutes bacterium]|jgi:large subunit ribosomal protein L17|nr:50S ribosomal protein L17 [Bacillota bacterium]
MKQARFGRDAGHRQALLRNLVSSVLLEERIQTTDTKAKAVRPLVEQMITLGKRGDLHARRQAAAFLGRPEAVEKLFDNIAPRYTERNGGYTRIIKVGPRRGDAAPVSIIELV